MNIKIRLAIPKAVSQIILGFFLISICPQSWSAPEINVSSKKGLEQKYFVLYQYVAEKAPETVSKEAATDKDLKEEKSRKKTASYFRQWRGKYEDYESGTLPDEARKKKIDEEGKCKPVLTGRDTICVPSCNIEGTPKETSYVKIFPLDANGNFGEPYTFTPEMIGPSGYVGPVHCALEAVKISKGEMNAKDATCPQQRLGYKITEVKEIEGTVEVRNFGWTLDKDGRLVQAPASRQYLGGGGMNSNRMMSDPCGFVHSVCYDPFLAGYGEETPSMCPCDETEQTTPSQVPPVVVLEPTGDAMDTVTRSEVSSDGSPGDTQNT